MLQSWGRVTMSPLWWKCPLAIGSSEHQLQKDSPFSQGGRATSQRPQDAGKERQGGFTSEGIISSGLRRETEEGGKAVETVA